MSTPAPTATTAKSGAGLVLAVLASSQFLMTLDSSVMNVSMPTVAADLGTTITGIQTAITLYTLVMATLMITGGKLGTIMGRRRAMGIGLVIYAAGSFTTGIAPNLTQSADRLVVAGGHRRGADHAGHRGAWSPPTSRPTSAPPPTDWSPPPAPSRWPPAR